jgi:hypothetical protein
LCFVRRIAAQNVEVAQIPKIDGAACLVEEVQIHLVLLVGPAVGCDVEKKAFKADDAGATRRSIERKVELEERAGNGAAVELPLIWI